MIRLLIVMLLVFPMCGVVSANEPTVTENSSTLEALTMADEILSIKALGRVMTFEELRLMCIRAHPLKKDELTILSNEILEKNKVFIEKYISRFFDQKRNRSLPKVPMQQVEKFGNESYLWSLEYVKKNGITNESPSLKSCIDAIKNFPLVP